MDVLIAGGHGKIALILSRLLADGGHTPRGLIRDPAQAADLQGVGARPVVCDLEHDEVDPHVGGAEAIVFAAGAGPGSGPERKRTVDYGAAVKCVDAAERLGVRRFVIVSSIGAHDPERGPGSMQPYLRAKAEADQRSSERASSGPSCAPETSRTSPEQARRGAHRLRSPAGRSRAKTWRRTLLALLEQDAGIRSTFELFSGDVPVDEAVRGYESGPRAVRSAGAARQGVRRRPRQTARPPRGRRWPGCRPRRGKQRRRRCERVAGGMSSSGRARAGRTCSATPRSAGRRRARPSQARAGRSASRLHPRTRAAATRPRRGSRSCATRHMSAAPR
jgi:hypothetical protein